jgi:hypothetical protein
MLASQGIKRTDLTREEFVSKVWEWKEKYNTLLLSNLSHSFVFHTWVPAFHHPFNLFFFLLNFRLFHKLFLML